MSSKMSIKEKKLEQEPFDETLLEKVSMFRKDNHENVFSNDSIQYPHRSKSHYSSESEILQDPIQTTTDDASISKLSSVVEGYYEDPYLYHMVKELTRRSPLINRGHFVRTVALRKVLAVFIKNFVNMDEVQVINIGAGLDTTYFWVQDLWKNPQVKFYEIDFPQVLDKKLSLFTRKPFLWNRLKKMNGARSLDEIRSSWDKEKPIHVNDTLVFIPSDIRQLEKVEASLLNACCSLRLPTLFISECVLVYIQTLYSDPFISWARGFIHAPKAFLLYEQVNPYDPFGRTMIRNLEQRGCPLLSIHDYPTLESQVLRFLNSGWDKITIADMNNICDNFVDKYEIHRIQKLELLDEMEEWRLMQAHYFVLVAVSFGQGDWDINNDIRNQVPLEDLSTIWENTSACQEELPRFTTEEIRQRLKYHEKIEPSPGALSLLLSPRATMNMQESILKDLETRYPYFYSLAKNITLPETN